MCHHARQLAVVVKYDPVRSGSFTAVKGSAVRQDGKLIVRGSGHKGEILVVVLRMWVMVAADGLSAAPVLAAGLLGVGNSVGVVGIVTAGRAVGLAFYLLSGISGWTD